MKKIILLVIFVLLLSGCDLSYEINFGKDSINEYVHAEMDGNIYEIASGLDGDGFYLEKELVEGKVPSLKGYKDYYSRKIKLVDDTSVIDLNYEYDYDNYEDSYVLSRCFEKSYVKNTDDYLYVSLGGNFKCFQDEDIRVKVSSVYDVVKHNADEVNDKYYIWDIKMADDENNIELYLSKDIKEEEEKSGSSFRIVLIVIFAILGLVIFVINKKVRE